MQVSVALLLGQYTRVLSRVRNDVGWPSVLSLHLLAILSFDYGYCYPAVGTTSSLRIGTGTIKSVGNRDRIVPATTSYDATRKIDSGSGFDRLHGREKCTYVRGSACMAGWLAGAGVM